MEKMQPLQGQKVDKSRLISLEKGKIPPQAVDLEEAVLGAMMIALFSCVCIYCIYLFDGISLLLLFNYQSFLIL